MTKIIVALLISALFCAPVTARGSRSDSWDNLRQLASGQLLEVGRADGEVNKGTFVSFSDESITIQTERQNLVVPRTQVSRIRLRPRHVRRNLWIGAGVGAAAGLGIGAGLGAGLSHESGGDFSNLQPAIIGATAAGGALAGAIIGSVLGGRHSTVYRAH